MNVECIDHVAIQVKDLEKVTKLFSSAFGMKFTAPKNLPNLDVVNVFASNGIEFVAPYTPDGPAARSLKKRGEGSLSVLSLKVANMDEALATLKSHGIRVVSVFESDNKKVKGALCHPADTFGLMVELVEYEKIHPIIAAEK